MRGRASAPFWCRSVQNVTSFRSRISTLTSSAFKGRLKSSENADESHAELAFDASARDATFLAADWRNA